MLTTRVRRTNILLEPVVVHLVDLVDQHETWLGEIVGRCHYQVPDTMCRESLVDLASDKTLLVLDVITGLRPFTPHKLRVVADIQLQPDLLTIAQAQAQRFQSVSESDNDYSDSSDDEKHSDKREGADVSPATPAQNLHTQRWSQIPLL